jgi:deazaflavin-dependent oxidoreductase (nitroreductase family)
MASDDYCYLTTTGRRSRRPHRIEIWYADDGDRLYLLSGGGHSADWVQNLVAQPSVTVERDGTIAEATARVVAEGDEAERARTLVYDKYAPRSSSDLGEWRRRALPVAIDLPPA